MSAIERSNILGVGISAINIALVLRVIDCWIKEKKPHYICVTGVHGVMESQASDEIRQIHNNAGLVTPDGMPLVWLSKLQGHDEVSRVYGPDLMLAVCEQSLELGYRHFLYGGGEGVPELLANKLRTRFPSLCIAGTYSPPFRELSAKEEDEIAAIINRAKPDIVWIGLSTPKQEKWMAKFVKKLEAPVLIGVGAAFDFHAELKKQAPLWMQRSGLEWLFRLLTEPRRLGKRYLINNPKFIILTMLQILRLRSYRLEI